jgi:imidazolonepropionase-like amidohydrolase
MTLYLTNLDLLDTETMALLPRRQILIEGDTVVRVDDGGVAPSGAQVVDLGGRVVMPGLIDCHVHVHYVVPSRRSTLMPSFVTAQAGVTLKRMLMSGFTTVRDAGGADLGHRKATEQELFIGPRMFVSGRAISQTGGHGDTRAEADLAPPCGCVHLMPTLGRIADGIPEVRRAVRDEIRLGADQIKIMAGGGCASPNDPLDQLQYSDEEIVAIVDEATRSHTYVMAHVYSDPGIRRCIEAGVRTIEHGSFLEEDTARMMVERGAILSANLAVYRLIVTKGKELGNPQYQIDKAGEVLKAGGRSLDVAKRAGLKVAFSSDVSAYNAEYQGDEFTVRAEVVSAKEIIRSATIIGAEVVRKAGRLGVIKPGSLADLIAVDGNPLDDIALLARRGAAVPFVMKNGRAYKDETKALPG